jgi:hypothetical protein
MRGFSIAVLLAALFCAAHPVKAVVLAQWAEVGAEGTATVRAISDGKCPAVIFDGKPAAMTVRAAPGKSPGNVPPAAFAVTSCMAPVPAGAKTAVLAGHRLMLPRPDPQRIVIFGDTGCRIEGKRAQACNDPKEWAFPVIAKAAAKAKADLVIHVGDYLYREDPCPKGNQGCAGSASGYGWESWNADFFAPAAPLLAQAPWLFVRGNHEDCDRAGEGWLRFLDAAPMPEMCRDFSGIFLAKLGSFAVVVVDAAHGDDAIKDADAARATLKAQFRALLPEIPQGAWLTTHRPLDAMRAGAKGAPDVVDNTLEESALGADFPSAITMLVSGHIHFFQALDFGPSHPAQLVAGTGGDILAPIPQMALEGSRINGLTVMHSAAYSGFAYMVWEHRSGDWVGTLYDADGKSLDRCRLSGRSLICGAA